MTPLLPAQTLSGVDRVHHMDALRLLGSLATGSIDLIVTSPPYDNLRTYNGYTFPFEAIAHESYRVLKQGGVLVWVVGDATVNGSETLTSFRQALYFKDAVGFRMHDTMIWHKNAMPGVFGKRYRPCTEFMFVCSKGEPSTFNPAMRRNKTAGHWTKKGHSGKGGWQTSEAKQTKEESVLENIWYVPVGGGVTSKDSISHPAMFPEKLAERHILSWSNEGDIVLDYFGGSGTTAKMARNNGRHYITGDISAEYVELMRKRLAQPWTMPMFAASA